ncbi:MAG: non-heme iron oxygenase ferredoxin subunit [Acidimicrobiia bacterium]
MPEVRVCAVDDVKEDSAIRVDVSGHRLAVVRIGDDGWYVLSDRCSHAEASLSGGEVWPDELEIECPKHGSSFSLETGEPLTFPATTPVPVYEVRVDAGDVLVRLP